MLNCAIIMGRLTADPELRKTSTGVSVTSFTVAVDRNGKVAEGQERQADFITVTAWRGTADFVVRYFRKGNMIAIQGSIQTRSYEDKNGNRRTAVEIVADNASFCGSRNTDGASQSQNSQNSTDVQQNQQFENVADGDFSFGATDSETDGLPF